MTLILKTSATTADIIKTWFDNLNRNTSKIVQYTKFLVAGGTNVKPNLTDPDQVAALLKNNLEFIQKTIQDKVVSYLSNIKKLTGNHPYLLTCRGINRRIDNVTDALNDAINKYKKFVEAWAEREEGVDQLQIQSNRAWEIVVDGLEKIEATVKALGENILREFSPTDFTPTSPQAPQGQIPSPPIFSNAPVAGGADSSSTLTGTGTNITVELGNAIKFITSVPAYLTTAMPQIQAGTFNDWNMYDAISGVCNVLVQYFSSSNPGLSKALDQIIQILAYVKRAPAQANTYLQPVIKFFIETSRYLSSLAASGSIPATQESVVKQEIDPNAQKRYVLKASEYISNILDAVLEKRESVQGKISDELKKSRKIDKNQNYIFNPNINTNTISETLKFEYDNLIKLPVTCDRIANQLADDDQKKIIIEFKNKINEILIKIKNRRKIWEEKKPISQDNYKKDSVTGAELKELKNKIEEFKQKFIDTTSTASLSINNFNKLAFKIHSAVEQFNHLVSLAKKQSGVATKTNPSLWSRCKSEAKSRMGGKHSARAMQLAVKLYKQRGGGYKGKKPTARTNKMKKWTKQKWMYLSDYKKKKKKDKNKLDDHLIKDTYFDSITDDQHSIKDENDAKGRYLPEAKWKSLSPKERTATDQKKKRQSKNKQYVPNTEAAKVKSKAKYY